MTVRLRLFWHILGAFLLTLTLLGAILTAFYHSPTMSDRPIRGFVQAMLLGLEHAVERGGAESAREQASTFPEQLRSRIRIEPVGSKAGLEQSELVRLPTAPDGRRYRVEYVPSTQSLFNRLPTPTLWGVLFAGALFSIAWAYHLSKPIKILSAGFRRLSAGDLEAELDPAITRHSHEFAGLAEDFARMTGRLKQLVGARDRLLHDVSHELRSPLTRLQLAIGLARQNPERMAYSLDRIEREAGKLNLLVDELLILAWAEGREEVIEDYLDPVATIRETVDASRLEATEKNVAISIGPLAGLDGRSPLIVGGATLFQRAIDNILRNAIRHSPRDSVIELGIELEESPLAYLITIRDHGPGVPEAMLGSIVEPFVHIDSEGTGLGLSIADRATRALGGEMVLANAADGGFIVRFRFPAVDIVRLSGPE